MRRYNGNEHYGGQDGTNRHNDPYQQDDYQQDQYRDEYYDDGYNNNQLTAPPQQQLQQQQFTPPMENVELKPQPDDQDDDYLLDQDFADQQYTGDQGYHHQGREPLGNGYNPNDGFHNNLDAPHRNGGLVPSPQQPPPEDYYTNVQPLVTPPPPLEHYSPSYNNAPPPSPHNQAYMHQDAVSHNVSHISEESAWAGSPRNGLAADTVTYTTVAPTDVVDQVFQDGYADGYADEYGPPSTKPKNKSMPKQKKLIIVAVAAMVVLGGLGGLIYWLVKRGSLGVGNDPNNSTKAEDDAGPTTLLDDDFYGRTESPTVSPTGTILPPPNDYNEYCSKVGIAADLQQCEDTCKNVICCYVPPGEILFGVPSCVDQALDTCALYDLCDFVFGSKEAIVDPLSDAAASTNASNSTSLTTSSRNDLVESCSVESGNGTACLTSCYDGYCCFSSASDILGGLNVTMPSCYDKERCEQYMPCLLGLVRSLLPAANSIPEAPENLASTCSDESMETQQGAVECMSHCSKALCCMDTESDDSCISDNVGICAGYAPCARIIQEATRIEPSSSEADEKFNSTSVTIKFNVTSPADDLADICDQDKLSENATMCANACGPGLCCFNISGVDCSSENETCSGYLPCLDFIEYVEAQDIDPTLIIPEPPIDLQGACELTTEVGRSQCLQSCYKGLCCHSTTESCVDSNLLTCLLYAPCESIFDHDTGGFYGIVPLREVASETQSTTVLAPPDSINTTCSLVNVSTHEGLVECFGTCSTARCCAADNDNCYSANQVNCDAHGPCLNLILAEPLSSDDDDAPVPPPDSINEVCNPGVPAFSPPDCQQICEVGRCCYDDTDEGCRDDHLTVCALYDPCLSFVTAVDTSNRTTEVPPAPDGLEDMCENSQLEMDAHGCADACGPALCCFDGNTECSNQNPESCSGYSPCLQLISFIEDQNITSNATVPDPPSDLDSMCELKSEADRAGCLQSCYAARCCLGEIGSCIDTHLLACVQYAPCENIYNIDTEDFDGIVPLQEVVSETQENVNFTAPEDINTTCSIERVLTHEGIVECFGMCSPARCCSSEVDNCYSVNKEGCDSYAPCINLILTQVDTSSSGNGEVDAPPDEINKVCAPELSTYSPTQCQEICVEARCCFDDYNGCRDDNSDVCNLYDPCLQFVNVVEDDSSGEETSSNMTQVEKLCSPLTYEGDPSECSALCEEGICCFLEADHSDNCLDKTEFCSYYNPCNIIHLDPLLNETYIQSVCEPSLIQNSTVQKQECEDICELGMCCHSSNATESSSSCTSSTDFCAKYQPCIVLMSNTTALNETSILLLNTTNTTSIIQGACASDYIASVGSIECEELCEEGACCRVADDSSSCQDEISFCEYYQVCTILSNSTTNATVADDADNTVETPVDPLA